MGSPARAMRRIALYVSWTLLLLPVQVVAVALGLPLRRRLPQIYHRVCCRILGFDIRVEGTPSSRRPTLFVCNHSSYADIEVLGALIQGSFVAKAEIARWPLFGWLAKLQRSVFIDRRVASTGAQRGEVEARLAAGDDLILFPEGTSDDGTRVRPFKSALFAVATIEVNGAPIPVQPVSIAYTKLDGIPLGRALRPLVAWYGDMDLASHAWALFGLGTITAEVRFYPPVTAAEFASRKALGEYCHKIVAAGVAASNSGRAPARAAVPAGSG